MCHFASMMVVMVVAVQQCLPRLRGVPVPFDISQRLQQTIANRATHIGTQIQQHALPVPTVPGALCEYSPKTPS